MGIAGNPLHEVADNPYLNNPGVRIKSFLNSTQITVKERDPQPIQRVLTNGGAYIALGVDEKTQTTGGINNFMLLIPKGTKNIMINTLGVSEQSPTGDNDIELFTLNGVHLAGTPLDDSSYDRNTWPASMKNWGTDTDIDSNSSGLGFTMDDYDGSVLNTGNPAFDPTFQTLNFTRYNGMLIGYSGDPERFDANPNDGVLKPWPDYELLTISEATEDLILWLPGQHSAFIRAYWDLTPDPNVTLPNVPDSYIQQPGNPPAPDITPSEKLVPLTIETQEKAQKALVIIDDAIVTKDKIRANLGALQNRLENTISNLSIQGESLQAAESRISDTDVALEMMQFVRNQVLTQSAVAMLGQANSYPHMLISLLNG